MEQEYREKGDKNDLRSMMHIKNDMIKRESNEAGVQST